MAMFGARISPRISPRTLALLIVLEFAFTGYAQEPFQAISLKSRITHVQPMTGIVLWSTSEHNRTGAIQLEYSYMKYHEVVKQKGVYDWQAMERLLKDVAGRGHQAIVRFCFVYPGKATTVPDYIKALPDYEQIRGKS